MIKILTKNHITKGITVGKITDEQSCIRSDIKTGTVGISFSVWEDQMWVWMGGNGNVIEVKEEELISWYNDHFDMFWEIYKTKISRRAKAVALTALIKNK